MLNNLVNTALNWGRGITQALGQQNALQVLITSSFVKYIFIKFFLYHTETDICELISEVKCM